MSRYIAYVCRVFRDIGITLIEAKKTRFVVCHFPVANRTKRTEFSDKK
jgi:hypothetical protein